MKQPWSRVSGAANHLAAVPVSPPLACPHLAAALHSRQPEIPGMGRREQHGEPDMGALQGLLHMFGADLDGLFPWSHIAAVATTISTASVELNRILAWSSSARPCFYAWVSPSSTWTSLSRLRISWKWDAAR